MLSPSKQKIIQIDVTNACPHRCSNCTRFVGHHKKPFFMTPDEFETAVFSLRDYPGMIGMMGGEPTIHPQFETLTRLMRLHTPDGIKSHGGMAGPHRDFAAHRNQNLSTIAGNRRGLWTSLGPEYARHYELIQDTFGYQCINDHAHDGKHRALLIDRKSLGIPDADWAKYRDNCWVQREWSASITPKGAFFCEVAGALDMLFDGPGGWKVETGWWKREPAEFGDQLHWCELCSACLPVPERRARDEVDDVSEAMAEKLAALGSRKKVRVFDAKGYDPKTFTVNHSPEPYIPDGDNHARVSSGQKSIAPGPVRAVIVCVGYDDYLKITLPHTKASVDKVVVVTDASDTRTKALCDSLGVECVVSPRIHEGGAKFAKGKAINDALGILAPGWFLVMDADIILPDQFSAKLCEYVLNPGVLYYTRRWGPERPANIGAFVELWKAGARREQLYAFANKEKARVEGRRGNAVEQLPFGYFQLFNTSAFSLRYCDTIYPERSATAEHDDKTFGFEVFPEHKRASLPVPEFDVIHLPHGMYRENWEGRRSPRLDSGVPLRAAGPEKFVCIRACFYGGRKYEVGERLSTSEWDVPKHFRRE